MDAVGPRATAAPAGTEEHAWLCVLASGSSGNCSALVVEAGGERHVSLIDLGLSPRRTRACLAELGLGLDDVSAVLLTHLDSDHWNPAWVGKIPERATVYVHARHVGRAGRDGACFHRTAVLRGPTELPGGAVVHTALHAHDSLGVSVFRVEFSTGAALGFATDVGRATPELVRHLSGVDVLAIESNYCPRMQMDSARPEFLKSRIMGGSGHLSNGECAAATAEIGPRERVVLLHLSRECNRPELALREHEGRAYAVTLASQFEPTPPVEIRPAAGRARPPAGRAPALAQGVLFG